MAETVGAELMEKFKNPIKFQWETVGAGTPPTVTHGFDATLLTFVYPCDCDFHLTQSPILNFLISPSLEYRKWFRWYFVAQCNCQVKKLFHLEIVCM
jgi:hypothetical protein